jgi:hypothetical protein
MNAMLFWLQVMQDWLNSANKTLTNYQHRVLMNTTLFWFQVMQDWLNSANKTLTNFQHNECHVILVAGDAGGAEQCQQKLLPTTSIGSL